MSLQCHLMARGSCIGMLHKTKPKRIRHQHLHFPLTNVTVKTDKDLNVEALFGVDQPSSNGGYSITSIAHVFINNCSSKRTIGY